MTRQQHRYAARKSLVKKKSDKVGALIVLGLGVGGAVLVVLLNIWMVKAGL